MALRGFAGFGDNEIEALRDTYADWWGQTAGQALTEEVRPEILEAEAMQARAAAAVPMAARASANQPSGLGKRVLTPLLVVGGIGVLLMLFASGKKRG